MSAADRTMVLSREIAAPVAVVWSAWTDPAALPRWWGPDGFTCRTHRIDLRTGGEWLFDMIGPDGTVHPNHHTDLVHEPMRRIAYSLRAGENGPKHADAEARFEGLGAATRLTLTMVMPSQEMHDTAKAFGAVELGHQTLGKLAAFVAP